MGRLSENSVVSMKNRSYSITAEVVVPKSGAEGVIVAQGGNTNGWSLYAKGGKLEVLLQLLRDRLDIRRSDEADSRRQPPGPNGVQVRGGGLAKAAT